MTENSRIDNPLRPGAFKGPTDNSPRSSGLQSKTDSTAETLPRKDNLEKGDTEGSSITITERTPEQLYVSGLEAVDLTLEEARVIMEALVYSGAYERTYMLGGKLPVVLRTRVYSDVQRTLRYAEAEAPHLAFHTDDLICRYNLAASLAAYGDTRFEFPVKGKNTTVDQVEEAFHERLDFVMSLNTPVASRLNAFLVDFDSKLHAVMADGAPQYF